jgi:hypothetical protein
MSDHHCLACDALRKQVAQLQAENKRLRQLLAWVVGLVEAQKWQIDQVRSLVYAWLLAGRWR